MAFCNRFVDFFVTSVQLCNQRKFGEEARWQIPQHGIRHRVAGVGKGLKTTFLF